MHHAPMAVVPQPVKVRRALISVSDKNGVVEFARALSAMGVTIISTGGTFKAIADAGVRCTAIDDVTGLPEMMDGRVKTLHPAIHGGLLAVRDNPEHAEALRRHRIEPIDLVVINLYPFVKTISKPGVTLAEAIENIDIGGPSMVRSAAKNHAYVAVVTAPDQYDAVLAELRASQGCTSPALRADLAQRAFAMTAAYDAAIAAYLPRAERSDFPAQLTSTYTIAQQLRYGENPHQPAAVYRDDSFTGPSIVRAKQLHGKELGYNNVADAAAALDLAASMAELTGWNDTTGGFAAAIIKHANPCGAAIADDLFTAIDRALAGDPVAAFGGILATSHTIDAAAAQRLVGKETFLEVIVAPGFTPEAADILKAKSANVRLLAVGPLADQPTARLMHRSIPGGLLVQHRDLAAPKVGEWKHAAGPKPAFATLQAASLVELIVRSMSSNAIAIGAIDGSSVRLLGGGVGQVDRVTACRLAVEKAKQFAPALLATGAPIAVSDAFFPFPDGPKILIDAGVKTIIHPGGSKRDQETFDLCNLHNVTCMVTGVRRFKH